MIGKRPGVGVGVIVEREGKVLLVQRTKHGAGSWSSPGGYVEHGEEPATTAIRETREETGIELGGAAFIGFTNDVHPDGTHNVTLWFAGREPAGQATIAAPDELSAVDWFAWDALPEPLFLPLQSLLAGRICRTDDTLSFARSSRGQRPGLRQPGCGADQLTGDRSCLPPFRLTRSQALGAGEPG